MPITLEILPDRNLVIRTVIGSVTVADFEAAIKEQFNDPRFVKGMHILWDLRSGASQPWSTQESQELSAFMASQGERRGDGRFAIVADANVAFGSARQYQSIGHNVSPEIAVFRTMDEALEWIERPV